MAELDNSCIRCTKMAGTLFIIWIPSERYERVLSNKQVWENVELKHEEADSKNINNNSSDEESNYKVSEKNILSVAKIVRIKFRSQDSKRSSMETFAISIESDSLNRDDKKNDETSRRKNMKRTKSADELSTSASKKKVRSLCCRSQLNLTLFYSTDFH